MAAESWGVVPPDKIVFPAAKDSTAEFWNPLQTDGNGNLNVNVQAGGGGGTSVTTADWTAATESSPASITAGDQRALIFVGTNNGTGNSLLRVAGGDWDEASENPSVHTGMDTRSLLYIFDPVSGDALRTTGGQWAEDDITAAARIAQDTRSLVYGVKDNGEIKSAGIEDDGALHVAESATDTIATASDQNVTTSPSVVALAAPAGTLRRTVLVQHNSTAASDVLRVGDTNVGAARGIRLQPGEVVTLETLADVFAVAETGSIDVGVTELL